MTQSVKEHLPVIVVVTILCAATVYFAYTRVLASAGSLDVNAFSTYLFGIPCIAMFLGSAIIMATAHEIGRQLYIIVVALCLVTGFVSMLVSSSWLSDPAIASALLANSAPDTEVVPVMKSAMTVLRDVCAYFVAGTVGSIFGAWIGSRLHPMTSERGAKGKKGSKKK